ncbi:MAG: transposase, partial [Trebonia sp.]
MYSSEVRVRALSWIENGFALRVISRSTGISRATLRDWRDHPEKDGSRASCPRCADDPTLPEPGADYAYLLGLYLGDGCISLAGDPAKRVWKLRVMCCDSWPGLIQECARAMRVVRP